MSKSVLLDRVAQIKPVNDFADHSYISLKNGYFFHTIGKAANSTVKHVFYELELAGTRVRMPSVHDRASSPLVSPRQLNDKILDDVLFSGSYFRFTFVRDPYARLLSCYLDRIADKGSRPYRQLMIAMGKQPGYTPSFAEFIETICRQAPCAQNNHWRVQYDDALMDLITYDYVGKQESFDADIDHVMSVVTGKRRDAVANSINASPSKTSSGSRLPDFWDPALAALAQSAYAKDFEVLGYNPEPDWLRPPAPVSVPAPVAPAAPDEAAPQAVVLPERRHIRLKEWGADIERVVCPTPQYLRQTNGTITEADYRVSTDEDGFILAPQYRDREGERVYVLGDSVVECSFVQEGKRFCDLLNAELEDRKASVLNGGYSGSTTLHLFNVLVNKVLARDPAHVLLILPSNDVLSLVQKGGFWNLADKRYTPVIPRRRSLHGADDFGANCEGLRLVLNLFCATARAADFRLTFASTPFVKNDYKALPWFRIRHRTPDVYEALIEKRRQVNRIMAEVASGAGVDFLDLEDVLAPALFYDDVHLNEKGCRQLASLLLPVIAGN